MATAYKPKGSFVAVQYTGTNSSALNELTSDWVDAGNDAIFVRTTDGGGQLFPGDYLIKYPDNSVFRMTAADLNQNYELA
jgi:hypothetical protein